MVLSKETLDQIRKEAEELYQGGNYPVGGLNNQYKREGYITGATAWAVWKEKAEGYEKALKEIAGVELRKKYIIAIANKAIEQFK